jgi:hypothetical protein
MSEWLLKQSEGSPGLHERSLGEQPRVNGLQTRLDDGKAGYGPGATSEGGADRMNDTCIGRGLQYPYVEAQFERVTMDIAGASPWNRGVGSVPGQTATFLGEAAFRRE